MQDSHTENCRNCYMTAQVYGPKTSTKTAILLQAPRSLHQTPASCFAKLASWPWNPCGSTRGPGQPKQSWQHRFGELTLPDFRTYCKATVVRRLWSWPVGRNVRQGKRIENLEIGFLDQESQDKLMGKESPFQQMGRGSWTSTGKRRRLDAHLVLSTKLTQNGSKT